MCGWEVLITRFIFLVSAIVWLSPNAQARIPSGCQELLVSVHSWVAERLANGLSDTRFLEKRYLQFTDDLRKRVQGLIKSAESAADSSQVAQVQTLFKAKMSHLENMERNLNNFAPRLRRAGVNVERVRADIWAHDLGKFTEPDDQVRNRHAFNTLISSEQKRGLAVKDLVARGWDCSQSEKLLSDLLEEKNMFGHFTDRRVKEWVTRAPDLVPILKQNRDGLAEFLDHSKTSRSFLFKLYGDNDPVVRQIALDGIGHDGPSVPGSWWGNHYSVITLRPRYPGLARVSGRVMKEAEVLQLLDRLDQVELQAGPDGSLVGGPYKIALEERARGRSIKDAILEGLVTVPDGTQKQLLAIRALAASEDRQPYGRIDLKIEQAIHRLREIQKAVVFYPKPTAQGSVGYFARGEEKIEFKSVEDFFQNVAAR